MRGTGRAGGPAFERLFLGRGGRGPAAAILVALVVLGGVLYRLFTIG